MSPPSPLKQFVFSDLLNASEQKNLQDPFHWQWIASLDAPEISPGIRHPRHQKWIANADHIHCPAMREIMFCLRGNTVFGHHGQVHRLRPGAVFLFGRHEGRDLVPAAYQRNYATLWLHFDKRESFRYNTFALDAEGKPHRELSARFREGDLPVLISDAWDQCAAFPSDRLCWTLLKASLTAAILELIGTARLQTAIANPQAKVIASMQDYIRHHPADDLSLQNLSRIAGYSPFFFHRIFLRYTGHTPRDFVNQVRIERAKELLRSNHTLETITEQIGLRHASYLSRLFKRYVHCTPGEWRVRAR